MKFIVKLMVLMFVLGISICKSYAAATSNALITELEKNFLKDGADVVNARLYNHWDEEMVPLLKKASKCHLRFLALTIQLRATSNATALQAYTETLQSAMHTCPAFVLTRLTENEVSLICSGGDAIDAYPNIPVKTVLRQRIRKVKAIATDALKAKVRQCVASYESELARLD